MVLKRALLLVVALSMTGSTRSAHAQPPPVPRTFTVDPATASCETRDQECHDWLRFRQSLAGPYQGIAVAVHGDVATVIFAEPPAPRDALLPLVEATFARDLIDRSYRRWSTGLDGWLEDLVLVVRVGGTSGVNVVSGHDLRPWRAPAALVDRLLFVYSTLFDTIDGFALDNVEAFSQTRAVASISELSAPAADILDWLTDSSHTWVQAGGDRNGVTFNALRNVRSPTVYTRSDGSLVTLQIPAKAAINELKAPFRRFAVASDLLLGGYRLANGSTFLVGRSRQLSFVALPPLRFETFESFVRHRTAELAQSYERQRVFAGRVRGGPFEGWDWAPILLSSQLDDSEFGTLLNQADQILKSWSQAGEVEYFAFNHPRPLTFPFDDRSATDYFGRRLGTTSLVFNWNTQALSTVFQVASGEVLAVDRLGALPVLYIPSGNIADAFGGVAASLEADLRRKVDVLQTSLKQSVATEAAAQAREYFAKRGDPILVRVAQNVLLYQLAQAFLESINAPADAVEPSRFDAVSRILRDEAIVWLRQVMAPGPMPGMSREAEAAIESEIRQNGLTIEQLAEMIATPQVTAAKLSAATARYQRGVNRLKSELLPQIEKVSAAYDDAFDAFCEAVNGQIKVRPESGTTFCEYRQSVALLAATSAKRDQVKALEARIDELNSESNTLLKTVREEGSQLADLWTAHEKATALAETLAPEASFTAQLDEILARVRKGVSGTPTKFIRTPALVLSRNTEDEDAIGGHSITFDPSRVRVELPITSATRPIAADVKRSPNRRLRDTIREPGARPAAKPVDALGVQRRGSLLEEMRPSYAGEIDPALSANLTTIARGCACDALVLRTEDGQIFFVRNQPPPVRQRLAGTTTIVDALGGPPRSRVVRFDGFADAPGFVESVVQATQLARGGNETTRLGRITELASNLFGRNGTPGGSALYAYARRNGTVETLRVLGGRGDIGKALATLVPWRGASVAPAQTTTLASGRQTTSTVVRFPAGRGPAVIDSVGVEVETDIGRPAVAPRHFQAAVTTALGQMPTTRSTVAEGVLTLRRAMQSMNAAEVRFFLGGGSEPIRVSKLDGFVHQVTSD